MRLGFIALLSRDWPMALGDSLNPDCTARVCRVPLLFMSILAQRSHPVVVASADCMSSISAPVSITGEHFTNQNEHLARLESRRASMSRAGTALIEHPTILSEYEK